MSLPPTLNASCERDRLRVDAGEQVVGEDDLLARALLRAPRGRPPRRGRSRRVMPRSPRRAARPSTWPPNPRADRWITALRERTGFRAERDSRRWLLSSGGRSSISTPPLVGHFAEHGWVVVDALARRRSRAAAGAGSTRSPRSPTATRCAPALREHRRGPAAVPQRELRARARRAARRCCARGPLRRGRRRAARRAGGALQGEGQLQAPRWCRVLAAPGRARVPDDRRARVGDGRGRRRRRVATAGSRWCRAASTGAPHRRARLHRAVGRRDARVAAGRRAAPGSTLWFHSRTPHRSGPTVDRPRRALYPTYNAAREGDRRAEYYDAKARRVRAAPSRATARCVSLIGDFEGRPV